MPLLVELPTVATDLGVTCHFTWNVRSSTEPPEKEPVAVIDCVPPTTSATDAGATVIELRTSFVTVRNVVPLPPGIVAESVAVPGATLVTRPSVPAEFEIVAAAGFEEDHRTCEFRFRLDPSL
jgi:hypothetical protein